MNITLEILKKIFFTLVLTLFVTGLNLFLHKFVDYRALGMIYLLAMNLYVLTSSNYNIFLGALLSSVLWNFLFIPPRFTFHIDAKEDWLMQVMFFTVAIILGKLSLDLKEKENILASEYRRKNRFYTFFKFFNEIYSFKDSKLIVEKIIAESLGEKVEVRIDFDKKVTDLHSKENWLIYPLSGGTESESVMSVRILNEFDELNEEELSYIDFCAHQLTLDLERAAFREANERNRLLIESQKVTNSLLNSVSHELRTPLSTVKGFATSLISNKATLESTEEIGREIIVGVERLDNVVQNLLDMSRLESGFIQLKKEGIDPLDLIQSAVARTKSHFPTSEIRLINEINDYEEIEGDYVLLRQCLENILRNACIYSNSIVDIFLKKNNDSISIFISDSGPGLKNPELIFQKFYREKPEIPGGTGLGLSITKSFIELHHAEIRAYNRIDNQSGAVFELIFKPCKA